MTHQDVVEREIADAYLAGTLTREERAAFEEHYFDCGECLAALEAADGLRAGVRHLAAAGELTDTGQLTTAAPAPLTFTPRARRTPVLPWLLAAAAMLLAAVSGWWLESQIGELRTELNVARSRATEQEQQLAQSRTAAPAPATQIARAESEANVPLAILRTARSAGEAEQLTVPASARHFIVWIEDAPSIGGGGELSLMAVDGRVLETLTGLHPNDGGAIVASFSAGTAGPGTYVLRLGEPGRPRALGEYHLTIVRP